MGETGVLARRWEDAGDATWSYLLATCRAAGSSEPVRRKRGQEPMSAWRTCLPVTSRWHSTCSLRPNYLRASFQKVTTLGMKKKHPTPPQMEDWKADHVAARSRSCCITRSKCGWQAISVDVYAICSRSLHVSAPKSCFCTVLTPQDPTGERVTV